MARNLLTMLTEALARNDETVDDIRICSHPHEILEAIATLDEINCFYLNSATGYDIPDAVHKQDMPFIALTEKYIYFYDERTLIENPDYDYSKPLAEMRGENYVEGVIAYKIDPFNLKRTGISYANDGSLLGEPTADV